MTVDQALEYCRRENMQAPYQDVIICGWAEDGSFFVRSSAMTRAEATHLHDIAKQYSTGLR